MGLIQRIGTIINDAVTSVTSTWSSSKIDAEIQAAIAGGVKFQGGYDASINSPNLTSPAAGAIKQGFMWVVTVAGTFFGENVEVGDSLIAQIDDPSTLTDWIRVEKNKDTETLAQTLAAGNTSGANDILMDTIQRIYFNGSNHSIYAPNTNQLYLDTNKGLSILTGGGDNQLDFGSSAITLNDTGNGTTMLINFDNPASIVHNDGTFNGSAAWPTLTASRTWTFPDKTGLVSLVNAQVAQYYVDADYGVDTNDGLSLDYPFATLGAAIDAANAGNVKCSIMVLGNKTYTVASKTITVDMTIAHPFATIAGTSNAVLSHQKNLNFNGYEINGTNLKFTFSGSDPTNESTHRWHRMFDPNTLYENLGTGPAAKYDVFVQDFDGTAGQDRGRVCSMRNNARFKWKSMNATSRMTTAGDTFYATGSGTALIIEGQNIDLAGAAGGYIVNIESNADCFIMGHCLSAGGGAGYFRADGSGSNIYGLASTVSGNLPPFVESNNGRVYLTALKTGLNFANLTATAGLSLTDTINTNNGTSQFSATLSQLQTAIVPPPDYVDEFGATVSPTSAGVWEVVTLPGAPANTVVEVLADRIGNNTHGVRAVGSTNARERDIRQSGTFTVKTNGSSQIEIKSSNTSSTFRLFGKFV